VDVGVEYFGFEVHFGRHNGVLCSEGDFDEEDVMCIGGVCGSLDEGFPTEEVVLVVHE
jgi:hypothetical protein